METGATHPDKIFIAADETSTRSKIQIRFSVSSDRSRYIWGSKKGELPNSSHRELACRTNGCFDLCEGTHLGFSHDPLSIRLMTILRRSVAACLELRATL